MKHPRRRIRIRRRTQKAGNLLTIREFARKHPSHTEDSLKGIRFKARPRNSSIGEIPGNIMDDAFIKVGSRLYVDEGKFFILLKARAKQERTTNSTFKVRRR